MGMAGAWCVWRRRGGFARGRERDNMLGMGSLLFDEAKVRKWQNHRLFFLCYDWKYNNGNHIFNHSLSCSTECKHLSNFFSIILGTL